MMGSPAGADYGIRFVAELRQHLDSRSPLDPAKLRAIQRLGFDDIASALKARCDPHGTGWLERMRDAPPEELARAIVRSDYTREALAPPREPWWVLLGDLLSLV
jgi:hypothetical protein